MILSFGMNLFATGTGAKMRTFIRMVSWWISSFSWWKWSRILELPMSGSLCEMVAVTPFCWKRSGLII